MIRLVAAVACGGIAAFALGKAAEWQNSVRGLMELQPVDFTYALGAALVALAAFAILLGLARLFRLVFRFLAAAARRFLPRRVASVAGVLVAGALFWSIISGVLVNTTLRFMDARYEARDKLIEPEFAQPTDSLKADSNASLLVWNELGKGARVHRLRPDPHRNQRLPEQGGCGVGPRVRGTAVCGHRASAPNSRWRN